MSFRSYIESHYVEAHNPERNVGVDKEMLGMLSTQTRDPNLVKKWMQKYGLFQGIDGGDRVKVVSCFLDFAMSHERLPSPLSSDNVAQVFLALLTAMHAAVPRGWLSATSKLVWCIYPHDIAIYDAYVHRTLTVMQCIDNDLSDFKTKIGRLRAGGDPKTAVAHYMIYQSMVGKLLSVHAVFLDELKMSKADEFRWPDRQSSRPLDWSNLECDIHSNIRILDKILWMIGDPNDLHRKSEQA